MRVTLNGVVVPVVFNVDLSVPMYATQTEAVLELRVEAHHALKVVMDWKGQTVVWATEFGDRTVTGTGIIADVEIRMNGDSPGQPQERGRLRIVSPAESVVLS